MRRKQDEPETLDSSQSYDVFAIKKILWNKFHDWSAGMEGYRLFWSDRQGRQDEGVALNKKEKFDCTASPLVMMWLRGSELGRQEKDEIL